jgi:hypothetical protein
LLEVELFTSDGSELILQPLLDAGLLTVEKVEQCELWYSLMYSFVAEHFLFVHIVMLDFIFVSKVEEWE